MYWIISPQKVKFNIKAKLFEVVLLISLLTWSAKCSAFSQMVDPLHRTALMAITFGNEVIGMAF